MADGVGELVRERREALAMSQEELARRAGMSRPYLSQIESGQRKWPRTYVPALAEALGLSVGDFEQAAGRQPQPLGRLATVSPVRPVPLAAPSVTGDATSQGAPDLDPHEWIARLSAALEAATPELTEAERGVLASLAATMMQARGHFPNISFDFLSITGLQRVIQEPARKRRGRSHRWRGQ